MRRFLLIRSFSSGPFETNGFLIADPKTKEALLIDAPPGSLPLYQKIAQEEGVHVNALLLTHSHWDHTADAAQICEAFSIPLYVHPLDAANLKAPGSDGLPLFFSIQPYEPDYPLEEGQKIVFGELFLEVIATPGHTPGGVSLYLESEHILFSGDTLFSGTIGNLSFPTANPEKMWSSLRKLGELPKNVIVYPGHGPSTTIGNESFLSDPERYFT